MKLKEITAKYRTPLILSGLALVLVIGILAWAWFGASSTVTVPKAEQYEVNANVEQQAAITTETQANDIRVYRTEAHTKTVQARRTLNQRKLDYAKLLEALADRPISNANLSLREHKLLSDLEQLYPVR